MSDNGKRQRSDVDSGSDDEGIRRFLKVKLSASQPQTLSDLSFQSEVQALNMTYAKSMITQYILSLIGEYSIYFPNQTQLDSCLKDVASMVGICMKNDDHACEKEGAVIGKLAFTYDEDRIDCMEVGIEGKTIPSNISKVGDDFMIDTWYLFIVEKDVVFRSLAKDNFYAQKKGCIILKAGKGLSDLATRLFVRQLLMRRKLYVYALVDTDRDGLRVLCDYGSIIPDLKWLGIRPSDLDKYEIPEECRLPMTNEDLKAGRDLLKEDFVKKNAAWVEELNLMEKMK
ncbi:DNA topoisomerase 6 subunit A, partial [Tanacetum coccineum]